MTELRTVRMKKLVVTETGHGKGVADDPVRIVTEIWTPEGALVALYDPCGLIRYPMSYPEEST